MSFYFGSYCWFYFRAFGCFLTDIYHYSNLYYIMVGVEPYQFPFFGGLMWGAVAVLSLRIAKKFSLNDFKTALLSSFFVVSMDLLLDVAAIRLSGGFWVWDGVDINLAINQHSFMSVIWVNFLGYMFETPSLIFYSKKILEVSTIFNSEKYSCSNYYWCLKCLNCWCFKFCFFKA